MPKRVTDLPQLTTPAGNDILVITDVSDNTTKQTTRQELLNNAVDTVDIKDNAVTTNKLANGSVTTAKLAANLNGDVYAGGTIGNNNGVQNKDLNEQLSYGITKTDLQTYTVVTKGIYFMHFQQLVNSSTNSPYLMIRINGVTVKQAWQTGSHMEDMVVSDLRLLNPGDTIRLYQSVAVANSWAAEHSSYQIFMLKRML